MFDYCIIYTIMKIIALEKFGLFCGSTLSHKVQEAYLDESRKNIIQYHVVVTLAHYFQSKFCMLVGIRSKLTTKSEEETVYLGFILGDS